LREQTFGCANHSRDASQDKKRSEQASRRRSGPVLLELVRDPEIACGYQLAFTLGEWASPEAGNAMVHVDALRPHPKHDAERRLELPVPHVETILHTILTQDRSDLPDLCSRKSLAGLHSTRTPPVPQLGAPVPTIQAKAIPLGSCRRRFVIEQRSAAMVRSPKFQERRRPSCTKVLPNEWVCLEYARQVALNPAPERDGC